MLFQSKKKKMELYLQRKAAECSAFDELVRDYLAGSLREQLMQLGIEKPEIHIDWLDDYKCIGIQGKHRSFYVDVQIEERRFAIACDETEPDDPQEYPLETKEQLYSVLGKTLKELA